MSGEQLLINSHVCTIEGIRGLIFQLKLADIVACNSANTAADSGKISSSVLFQELADFFSLLPVHIKQVPTNRCHTVISGSKACS